MTGRTTDSVGNKVPASHNAHQYRAAPRRRQDERRYCAIAAESGVVISVAVTRGRRAMLPLTVTLGGKVNRQLAQGNLDIQPSAMAIHG